MTTAVSFLAIAGTRPEFLKLWPLMRELGQDAALLWTGQQGADPPLQAFGISVLKLASPAHPLSRKTLLDALVRNIGAHLRESLPRLVIVQGDTATALAGARAANGLALPLVHLEAGLRSDNLRSPFPEEAYRREITERAALHLAPSRLALARLKKEGRLSATTILVGSTAIDLVRNGCAAAEIHAISDSLPFDLLIAVHRRENLSLPLRHLAAASRVLLERHGWRIAVSLHPNPQRQLLVQTAFAGLSVDWLSEMAPQEWWRQACHASLVLSDSGGALEELPYLGARLCVYRRCVERPEALASGHALAVPPARPDVLVDRLRQARSHQWPAPWPFRKSSPYGDGKSGARAAAAIRRLPESRYEGKRAHRPTESVDRMQALAELQSAILARRIAADARAYCDRIPLSAIGAFDVGGKALYAYPEIAGYWLQWASARSEIDDADLLPLLEWLRSVQGADGRWPARIGLAEAVPLRYRQGSFLFDHAMLRRGLASTLERRGLALARELLQAMDRTLAGWMVEKSIHARIPPAEDKLARWSDSNGCFLLKVRSVLVPLVDLREKLAAAFPIEAALLAPHREAHPQLYAIEGLIGLGAIDSARQAWSALRKQLNANGEMSESVNGVGPVRSDILAQALRVALLLDGHANVCATPAMMQLCARLISRIDTNDRMPFAEGGPRIAWAAIFAEQALRAFALGSWAAEEAIT